ncbi:hypothetical protein HK405_007192, partial [Cladochytrium tenue]
MADRHQGTALTQEEEAIETNPKAPSMTEMEEVLDLRQIVVGIHQGLLHRIPEMRHTVLVEIESEIETALREKMVVLIDLLPDQTGPIGPDLTAITMNRAFRRDSAKNFCKIVPVHSERIPQDTVWKPLPPAPKRGPANANARSTGGAAITDLLKDLDGFTANGDDTDQSPLDDGVSLAPSASRRGERLDRKETTTTAFESAPSEGGSRSKSNERNRIAALRGKSRDRATNADARSRGAPTVFDDDGTTAVGGALTSATPRKRAGSGSSTYTAIDAVLSDPTAITLMIPDAVNDSKSFHVLVPEKIEERRREFSVLSSQVSSLQNRLSLESKIREAALNLVKSTPPSERAQARTAQEELAAANRKVDTIAAELWKVTGKLMEVEKIILKHTAAILRWAHVSGVDIKTGIAAASGASAAEKARLESAETKLKESELEISVLKATVARLESEGAASKKVIENEREKALKMERDLEESELHAKSLESENKALKARAIAPPSPSTPVGSSEVNRVKLELATCRAELSATKEDLVDARSKIEKQGEQIEELQGTLEEKDRSIANLLGELEEVTNKLEMKTAANEALLSAGLGSPSGGSTSPERQLRAEISALEAELREATKLISKGSSGNSNRSSIEIREQIARQVNAQTESVRSALSKQLKDAVADREKFKAQLASERSKVADLEFEIEGLKDRVGGKSRGVRSNGSDDESVGYASSRPRDARDRDRTRGVKQEIQNITDSELASLKRLYTDVVATLEGGKGSPPRDGGGPFTIDNFINRVNRLMSQKRDLLQNLESMEDDMGQARKDAEKARQVNQRLAKDLEQTRDDLDAATRAAEDSERELKGQLRAAERAIDRLKDDLEDALQQSNAASVASGQAAEASKRLEEMHATHTREVQGVKERAENRVREVEEASARSAQRSAEEANRRLEKLQREYQGREEMLQSELDEAKRAVQQLEVELRNLEEQSREQLEAAAASRMKEVSDAVEKERVRTARVQNELEKEIDDLARQVQETESEVEGEIRRRVMEEQ